MTIGSRRPSTLATLLFITAGFGILLAGSAFLVLTLLAGVTVGQADMQMAGLALWTGAGMAAVALALAPAAYLSGRILFGETPRPPGRPSARWLVAIAGYPVFLALGAAANSEGAGNVLFAALALVGTAFLPVLLIGWVVRRLGPAITPVRSWGHFTVGLTGMPLLALTLEAALLLPLLILLAFWLVATPDGAELFAMLDPGSQTDPEAATEFAMSFLQSPLALAGIYGYVALAIPAIEELVKTMAVWPFLRRGLSPTEAFLGGALGGAGYALFEALFLTQPGEVWLITTLARAGATLLHVFTAALASWGLLEGIHRRRFGITVAAFAVAISMHGLWNLTAVTIGISTVPVDAGLPATLAGLAAVAPALLACLTAVSALGLISAWRLMESPAESQPLETASPPE